MGMCPVKTAVALEQKQEKCHAGETVNYICILGIPVR